MKEYNFDRLDALIGLSIKASVEEELQDYYNMDVEVSPSEKKRKKTEHIIRYYQNQEKYTSIKKVFKVIALACLLSISLVFTACVSIAPIRTAMWEATVEWFDDYIAIRFQNNSKDGDLLEPPKAIEKLNVPGYLPDGYSTFSYKMMFSFYQEYYDENGEYMFTFVQNVHGQSNIEVDSNESAVEYTTVNGMQGVWVENEDILSLSWQDDYYSYTVQGGATVKDEIQRIAESVLALLN